MVALEVDNPDAKARCLPPAAEVADSISEGLHARKTLGVVVVLGLGLLECRGCSADGVDARRHPIIRDFKLVAIEKLRLRISHRRRVPEGRRDWKRAVDVILLRSRLVARPRHQYLPRPHALVVLQHRKQLVAQPEDSCRDVLCEAQLEPIFRSPKLLAQEVQCLADADVPFTLDKTVLAQLQPQLAREVGLNELVDRKCLVLNRSITNPAIHGPRHVPDTPSKELGSDRACRLASLRAGTRAWSLLCDARESPWLPAC